MQKTFNIRNEAVLVFFIALALTISNIWGYPITILDEAKNTEAAREMFFGNHFLPTFNETLRTDKPPLHYFFMQLGMFIFGVNEFAVRFFGALLGASFITGLYIFLRRFTTINIARITSFILLSAFFWIQEFHLAVPDPYLITFLCGAWLFFYAYWRKNDELQITNYERKQKPFSIINSQLSIILFYIFVGLATLAKGPVAIGLSGLIVLIFLIVKKEFTWKKIWKYRPILGGILVLLISSPWFLWVHHNTSGAFTNGFFIEHNMNRFGSEMEGHGGIFLLTWVFVLLGLFPFGAFIPQGFRHGYKFFKRNDFIAFSFIASVVVVGFFSISSTKLPNYTLPAVPFLAILIAGFFEEIKTFKTSKKWWNSVSLGLISLVALAIPVAVFVLFYHELIQHYQIIFVILFTTVSGVGLYFIWTNYLRENIGKWILSVGVLWITLGLMIFYLIYPNLSKIEPVSQAQNFIKDKEVVVYKAYDPSFNFNYKQTFDEIHTEQALKTFVKSHPNTLILTKDKKIKDSEFIQLNFQQIFNEPCVFENYRTIILKYVGE